MGIRSGKFLPQGLKIFPGEACQNASWCAVVWLGAFGAGADVPRYPEIACRPFVSVLSDFRTFPYVDRATA